MVHTKMLSEPQTWEFIVRDITTRLGGQDARCHRFNQEHTGYALLYHTWDGR